MQKFSAKVHLTLTSPSEESPVTPHQSVLTALSELGYKHVTLSLSSLQQLHSVCLVSDYSVTVSLVYRNNGWYAVSVEQGNTTDYHYGLAVDYGSTTIIMQLIDMNTGAVLAQTSEKSGQVDYGTDILTRITYTMEDPAHADELQQATVRTFHSLLQKVIQQAGIRLQDCPAMIISGNTTMIHFLLKLDARTVFFSPYAPVTMDPGWFTGLELGLNFPGIIYIIPSASNYIGGDIISGLLTVDLHKQEETSLFFDIGTNGELVIGNQDWILAGAGAAGPALEGYISRFGMRAQSGAIDTVRIQKDILHYTTINNAKPIGICGSGIIDLLAQMRLNGWINIAGKLNPKASSRIILIPEEQQYAAVYALAEESATGEPLYFSQTDIDQYLDTKAAAYTMVASLLDTAGIDLSDLHCCYLSGAFSAHSDLESAITIGIFPDLPREKYIGIANSSLDGARTLLLDRSRLKDIQYLIQTMYCVQLASIPDFLLRMQAAKFVPHTDMNLFPTVAEKLKK